MFETNPMLFDVITEKIQRTDHCQHEKIQVDSIRETPEHMLLRRQTTGVSSDIPIDPIVVYIIELMNYISSRLLILLLKYA